MWNLKVDVIGEPGMMIIRGWGEEGESNVGENWASAELRRDRHEAGWELLR